jgi:hypothetical protein
VAAGRSECRRERVGIVVIEHYAVGLRESCAVSPACVTQLVQENDVAPLSERRQNGEVGQISAGEVQRSFATFERCEGSFGDFEHLTMTAQQS